MLGAFINIIGSLLQSSSFSLGQLIVGRLVSGFGFGHLTATAPNWQAECSGAHHRGAAVLLESVFISGGLAIAAWTTFGISHTTGSVTWRFPLALSSLWSIIILLTTPHMPESPRWLIRKGKVEEARQTLAALKGTEIDDAGITDDVVEIEESLALVGQARFTDLFRNGELRLFHRTCLAAAGQMFQQVSEPDQYPDSFWIVLWSLDLLNPTRCPVSTLLHSIKRPFLRTIWAYQELLPGSLRAQSSHGRPCALLSECSLWIVLADES